VAVNNKKGFWDFACEHPYEALIMVVGTAGMFALAIGSIFGK
jgi:hypothetical protein